jgi:hypothetical protein
VRLKFVLTANQKGTSDPGFIEMYEMIIDSYNRSGIGIYALIGVEAVKQGYDRDDPGAFVGPFTDACVDIISRWQDRISVFELFNEPNEWAGGTTAQMTPYYFAALLQSVYQRKLYYRWTASLISGPLFSFDGSDASDYLYQTYLCGMTQLHWDWFYQNANTYPLDGIGYHISTTQGSTDGPTVKAGILKNLNGIWGAIISGESYRFSNPNPNTKKIWVSEYGWGSDIVGLTGQANNLEIALNTFENSPVPVALTLWFTLTDFGGPNWGLRTSNNVSKPSWDIFSNWTHSH